MPAFRQTIYVYLIIQKYQAGNKKQKVGTLSGKKKIKHSVRQTILTYIPVQLTISSFYSNNT
jgi:hypothetical protein